VFQVELAYARRGEAHTVVFDNVHPFSKIENYTKPSAAEATSMAIPRIDMSPRNGQHMTFK